MQISLTYVPKIPIYKWSSSFVDQNEELHFRHTTYDEINFFMIFFIYITQKYRWQDNPRKFIPYLHFYLFPTWSEKTFVFT